MGKKTVVGVAAAAAGLAWAAHDLPAQFGAYPDKGARGDRVRRAPQVPDGEVRNAPATKPLIPNAEDRRRVGVLLFGGKKRQPGGAIPVLSDRGDGADDHELHITWFGHASSLVEIDGARV